MTDYVNVPFAAGASVPGRVRRPRGAPIRAKGRPGFKIWLQRHMPEVYRTVQAQDPQILGSLGQQVVGPPPPTATTTASKSWADRLLDLATPALQIYQQKKIFEMQMKRAQQGLPPVDVADYQPALQVEAGKATRNTVLIVAGVLAGGLLLMSLGGRRR